MKPSENLPPEENGKETGRFWKERAEMPVFAGSKPSGLKGEEKEMKSFDQIETTPRADGAHAEKGAATMDRAGQAEGEKRVMELLIEPLLRRGLARPSGSTVASFEDQKRELCARLAYMSDLNLQALEETVAAQPAGKERDRLPVANWILAEAARIQEPQAGASPLMRAVFAADLGRRAVRENWAPELLDHLRGNRVWPGPYVVSKIMEAARPAIRRFEDLARYAEKDLTPEEQRWLAARRAKLKRCAELVALAEAGA